MNLFRLTILDRYLLRDVLQILASVLIVLLLILLSNELSRFLKYAASGDWPVDIVMPMLGLSAVNSITFIMPMAVFLAVILAVGRLYKDSEMTVIAGCGISTWRLYKPLGLLAFGLAVIFSIISFVVLPETTHTAAILKDRAEKTSEITGIAAGRFQESGDGKRVIYVEKTNKDNGEVENIFVHSRTNGQINLMTAKMAYQYKEEGTGDTLIFMNKGYRYTGQPGESNFRITRFDSHWIRTDEGRKGRVRLKYESKSTLELIGADDPLSRAELHWRIAMVVSPVLFVLLGLPLGRLGQREGRYGRIMVGVLIYIIYFKLLRVGQVMLEREIVPAWWGIWWVHLGLVAYLVWTLIRESKVRSNTWFSRWRFRRAI